MKQELCAVCLENDAVTQDGGTFFCKDCLKDLKQKVMMARTEQDRQMKQQGQKNEGNQAGTIRAM